VARETLLSPQRDPRTGLIRKARVVVCRGGNLSELAEVSLHLPYNAKSPNETLVGRHWGAKAKLTKAWETAIKLAIGDHIGATTVSGYDKPVEALGFKPVAVRMRVSITRLVPNRRNFIKDDDNLGYIVKPINDALKRLGFLKDDKRQWLEQPRPGQAIAGDGLHWTVIRIEPSAETYEAAGGFEVHAEKILQRAGAINS
jgi:hypothetical protein